MAFISTKFDIGDTVYWHDAVSDSVARGKVESISVLHDANREPRVSYGVAAFPSRIGGSWTALTEGRLCRSANEAFPEPVAVAEPITA